MLRFLLSLLSSPSSWGDEDKKAHAPRTRSLLAMAAVAIAVIAGTALMSGCSRAITTLKTDPSEMSDSSKYKSATSSSTTESVKDSAGMKVKTVTTTVVTEKTKLAVVADLMATQQSAEVAAVRAEAAAKARTRTACPLYGCSSGGYYPQVIGYPTVYGGGYEHNVVNYTPGAVQYPTYNRGDGRNIVNSTPGAPRPPVSGGRGGRNTVGGTPGAPLPPANGGGREGNVVYGPRP